MEKLENKYEEKFAEKLANLILKYASEEWNKETWKKIEKRAAYLVTRANYGPPCTANEKT